MRRLSPLNIACILATFLFFCPAAKAQSCTTYYPNPNTFLFFSPLGGAQYQLVTIVTQADGTVEPPVTTTAPIPSSGPGAILWGDPLDYADLVFGQQLGHSLFQSCNGTFASANCQTISSANGAFAVTDTVCDSSGAFEITDQGTTSVLNFSGSCLNDCLLDQGNYTNTYMYDIRNGAYTISHSSSEHAVSVDPSGNTTDVLITLSGSASGVWPITSLAITTPMLLPEGNRNDKYGPVTLQVTGGTSPYGWDVSGLPPSLSFNVNGTIFGTPTVSNVEFPQLPAELNPFTLHVTVKDGGGNAASKILVLNITDNPNAKFKTPQEANSFLLLSIEYSAAAAAALIAAGSPPCLATVICPIIMEAQFEGFTALAIKYYAAALDPPDPNYTVVSYPVAATLPLLSLQAGASQEEIQGINPLLTNMEQQIGLAQALVTAINRAQGAEMAHNLFWQSEQLRAASSFATQLANLNDRDSALRSTAGSSLQTAGINPQITAQDFAHFTSNLTALGLSATAINELLGTGLTLGEVNALSANVFPLFSANDAIGSYSSILTEADLASAESAASAALRSFAARNSVSQFTLGDVNGDGRVDCTDLAIVKASFGKKANQTGFDTRADVNKDAVVNILDLSAVAKQLPAGTVCK